MRKPLPLTINWSCYTASYRERKGESMDHPVLRCVGIVLLINVYVVLRQWVKKRR